MFSFIIHTGVLLGLCVSLLQLEGGLASKLMIEASDHSFTRSNFVEITCKPDGKESDAGEFVMFQITGHNDNLLASIERGPGIKANNLPARYKVYGSMASTYLKLTINNPQLEDFGKFGCRVSYTNFQGSLQLHPDYGVLSETDILPVSGKQVENLYNEVSSLKSVVQELKRKDNLTSAFSATNKGSSTLTVKTGQKVVFDNLVLDYGLKGYDTRTGIYTVPVDGLYVFHVTIGLNCKSCSYIGYVKADSEVLSGILVHDKDYYDQASVTVMASLKKGAKVFTVTHEQISSRVYGMRFSSFSGNLIKAD